MERLGKVNRVCSARYIKSISKYLICVHFLINISVYLVIISYSKIVLPEHIMGCLSESSQTIAISSFHSYDNVCNVGYIIYGK